MPMRKFDDPARSPTALLQADRWRLTRAEPPSQNQRVTMRTQTAVQPPSTMSVCPVT